MPQPPRALAHASRLLGLGALTSLAAFAAQPDEPVQQLSCTLAHGVTLSVLHQGARVLALQGDVVAGERECGIRSNQPAQLKADGSWQLEWTDDTVSQTYRAQLSPLPQGGWGITLQQVGEPAPTCGALALPARSTLTPDGNCKSQEDRSIPLQAQWHTLRDALLRSDAAALLTVLAPRVTTSELNSPRQIPREQLAAHVRCLAHLPNLQPPPSPEDTLGQWAKATPRLSYDTLGVSVAADRNTIRLLDVIGLTWQPAQHRWALDWINADPLTLLDTACPALDAPLTRP